jgi:RHS repeat-associated protein
VKIGSAYAATIYTYNNQNRLTKTISSNGIEMKYIYDYNGNLINKTINTITAKDFEEMTAEDLASFDLIIKRQNENGTGTKKITYYSYDHYNRLIETKSENTTSTYGYNAQGYRVEKKVNNETTRYLYEADKVVLETDENNNQKALQVYGSNLLYCSTAADSELGAQSYYYLYNAHGDVTELIDAQGIIAATYNYDAFGNIISNTGNADNSITYAGYQYDKESGLYYLNARYYDSVTARFITEDDRKYSNTNDPLSLNLYTYCHNEPIMYTDPSGHKNLIQQYKDKADKEQAEKEKAEKDKAAKEKAAKDKAAKEKAAKEKAKKDSNNVYQVSDNGVNFLANLEVGENQLVLDSKGKILGVKATNSTTIGYGYDIGQDPLDKNIKKATKMSQADALDLLNEGIYYCAVRISDPKDITIDLNQYQVDALVALRYNAGGLGGIDGLLEDINNGASYDTLKNDLYSHYEAIVEKHTSQAKNLDGWLNRVDKILNLYFNGDYGEMPVNAVEGVYNGKK